MQEKESFHPPFTLLKDYQIRRLFKNAQMHGVAKTESRGVY